MEKDKRAQRGAERLKEAINIVLNSSIVYQDPDGKVAEARDYLRNLEAIPVDWLRDKMEKSSGFRHAVLSETIEEWEGEKKGYERTE